MTLAVTSQAYDQNLAKNVVLNYTELAHMNYEDSLNGALKLDQAITYFVNEAAQKPNARKLPAVYTQLKSLWADNARIPYGQSEIFRFYNGPIDFEFIDDGVTTHLELINFSGVEGLLNAWPLDEAYIDYVTSNKRSGVINDKSIMLSKEQITIMNERNGEKNISSGYHAIEFLLWGQDKSLTGPGNRPYTDYIDNGTAQNQDRRREYLTLTSNVMIDHLDSVVNQWKPATVNYRQEFEVAPVKESLTKIFTSLIAMTGDELKSERIENSFYLEDQEEEHSCFSDKTINDIYTNAKGVMNVYFGDYKSFNSHKNIDGLGLNDLLGTINPKLNNKIEATFKDLMTSIHFFYNKDAQGEVIIGDIKTPFDVAIFNNKLELQEVIDHLEQLDTLLRNAAQELGLSIEI